jgi:hypothetical protein
MSNLTEPQYKKQTTKVVQLVERCQAKDKKSPQMFIQSSYCTFSSIHIERKKPRSNVLG